jgi:hypothetical protein
MATLTVLYSGHEGAWLGSYDNLYIGKHLISGETANYWAIKAAQNFTAPETGLTLLRFFDHHGMDDENTKLHALAASLRVMTLAGDDTDRINDAAEFIQKHFTDFDFLSSLQKQQALKQAGTKALAADLFLPPEP